MNTWSSPAPSLTAAHQVALQPRGRGVVQWHQAGFSELGFPNQQAIFRDVCKSQPQRLRNTQARWTASSAIKVVYV